MFEALFQRAKGLILKPAETWDAIAAEDAAVPELYKTWILPLAAIPAVASLIGLSIVGTAAFGVSYRVPFTTAFTSAVVSYALSLGSVYVFALIVDALAPHFGAEKNFKQAFKVAAYFPIAAWLAGVFALIPALSILSIVGLYSLYLLFLGLPKLMKPAEGKGGGYTLAALGVAIVIWIVVALIAGALVGGNAIRSGGMFSGGVRPGSSALERSLAARDDALNRAAESGDVGAVLGAVLGGSASSRPLVDTDALREMPPDRLAGLQLSSSRVEETGAPFPAVVLQARYGEADKSISLQVVNSPMLSTMLSTFGLAGAVHDERTDDGFDRLRRDGDALVIEQWSRSADTRRYGRTVGDDFLIDASGQGVSENELHRAVDAFSERQLNRLPRRPK